MKPLMLEMISGGKPFDEDLEKEVEAYINESTGIQTIHQMKWLAATIRKHCFPSSAYYETGKVWYRSNESQKHGFRLFRCKDL